MENYNFELTKQHLNTKVFKGYFSYISKYYPNINISELCDRAGLPITYFDNPNSWVSIEFDLNFIRELRQIINDSEFEFKVGQASFNKDALGPVYFLVKNILTLEEIYNNIWRFPKYMNKVVTFDPIERRSGYIKIRLLANLDNLSETEKRALKECLPAMVDNSLGYYSGFSKVKNLTESKINAIRISEYEYHLEVKYPLERSKFFLTTLYPFGVAISTGALSSFFLGNFYQSVGVGALAGLSFFSWLVRKRNVELLEAANQAEETLNRLDIQYRTLVDTKLSLQRKLAESEAINELTNALIQTTSEEEILQNATDKLTQILNFDRVLIMLNDQTKKFIEVRSSSIRDPMLSAISASFRLPIDIDSNDPTKISNIYKTGSSVLISDVGQHIKTLNEESRQLLAVSKSKSFVGVPVRSANLSHGVILADTFFSDRVLTQDDLNILSLAGRQIAMALEKQKAQADAIDAYVEIDKLAKSYSRFVPFETIELLGFKSVTDVDMQVGREMNMTIVFCDIRGFTTMAESMSPAEAMAFLNSYFTNLAPVFRNNRGIIDKFMGDGIMALFENSDDALRAAGEFQSSLVKYNERHRSGGKRQLIRTGMGIHFGKVLMGAVGYEDRLSISVVSDAVNLTSRLDGLTKKFGIDIICSEDVYNQSNEKRFFRLIAQLKVDGRAGVTRIYEYFGHLDEKSRDNKEKYKDALEAIVSSDGASEMITRIPEDSIGGDTVLSYYFELHRSKVAA